MTKCWLYIYENPTRREVYIGIADSMTRAFQPHNPAAEALREAHGTTILQTVTPFSSRADARKAEAIAIHIAATFGATVFTEGSPGEGYTATNIAGMHSTKELAPAVLTRPGETADASTMTETVFVSIKADQIDDRPAPFGAVSAAAFSERASQYWDVAVENRPRIKRLVAALSDSGIILGDWDVDPDAEWVKFGATRVQIPLVDPTVDDPRGIKGAKLTGHSMNSGVTYSADLKAGN